MRDAKTNLTAAQSRRVRHRWKVTRFRWVRLFLAISSIIVVMEFAGFYFLEKLLLSDAQFVSVSQQTEVAEGHWKIPEPYRFKKVELSSDGTYAACLSENNIVVSDLTDHKIHKVISLKGKIVSTLQWLPDRNRFLYATTNINGKGSLQLWFFDADNKEGRLITKIPRQTSFSRISSIALSPLTNLIYIKINDSNRQYRLYRLNIMNRLNRQYIRLGAGTLAVLPDKDGVLVENLQRQRVNYISGLFGTIHSNLNNAVKQTPIHLLGVDENGRIYLEAFRKSKKGYAVFRGKLNHSFRCIGFLPPIRYPDRIILTPQGKLFLLNTNHKLIRGIFSKNPNQFHYPGQFISFDGRILAVINDEELTVGDLQSIQKRSSKLSLIQ